MYVLSDIIIIIRKKKNECAAGEAPKFAKQGLVRPDKFEPKAGHQLKAVKYIREQLFASKLGKITDEAKGLEGWEEPEASEVEEEVWTEIRKAGFAGKVKNRDLRRIWKRRASIRERVELL